MESQEQIPEHLMATFTGPHVNKIGEGRLHGRFDQSRSLSRDSIWGPAVVNSLELAEHRFAAEAGRKRFVFARKNVAHKSIKLGKGNKLAASSTSSRSLSWGQQVDFNHRGLDLGRRSEVVLAHLAHILNTTAAVLIHQHGQLAVVRGAGCREQAVDKLLLERQHERARGTLPSRLRDRRQAAPAACRPAATRSGTGYWKSPGQCRGARPPAHDGRPRQTSWGNRPRRRAAASLPAIFGREAADSSSCTMRGSISMAITRAAGDARMWTVKLPVPGPISTTVSPAATPATAVMAAASWGFWGDAGPGPCWWSRVPPRLSWAPGNGGIGCCYWWYRCCRC